MLNAKVTIYIDRKNIKKKLNNSDLISNSGISLPSFPSLKSNEIKYISTQIINFFKKNEWWNTEQKRII